MPDDNETQLDIALKRTRSELSRKLNSLLIPGIADIQEHAFNLGVGIHYSDFNLVSIIRSNVDNEKLTDAEFRLFIRNRVK